MNYDKNEKKRISVNILLFLNEFFKFIHLLRATKFDAKNTFNSVKYFVFFKILSNSNIIFK